MVKIEWLFLAMITSLLAACTPSLPNKETIAYPTSVRSGQRYHANVKPIGQVTWWQQLHDKTLNHFIEMALANNNQLKTADANIRQAQAKLQEAHAAWLPTLDLSGNAVVGGTWHTSATPQGILAQNPLLGQMSSSHFQAYYGGFTPRYTLNVLANIENDKFAKASLAMQEAAYQAARISVISQITGAYFMLLSLREQSGVEASIVNDLIRLHQLELARYHNGASDLSTVAVINQQLATARANLVSVENSIVANENAMQVLLNHNPGAVVTQHHLNSIHIQGMIPARLSSLILKTRPDIIMAEQNLKMANANVGMAYANYFPAISLTGLLDGASVDLTRLLKASTAVWLAKAAASMPLLNVKIIHQINGAKAGEDAAFYAYVETVRSAFADVDTSLTNLQNANLAYHQQAIALQAAHTNLKLARARYQAGAKDYRDVLNAHIADKNAQLTFTFAKTQQLDALVQIYQALAGSPDHASPIRGF